MAEQPAWMQRVEIRYGADGEILNAEEIVTAWWRHVVEQDDDSPRNRKELEDKVIKMFREQFDDPEAPDCAHADGRADRSVRPSE